MKKLLTLMIALAAFVGVQAQSPRDEARARVLGAPRTANTYPQQRVVVVNRGPAYDQPRYNKRDRRRWEKRRRVEYNRHDHGHHYGWYKHRH